MDKLVFPSVNAILFVSDFLQVLLKYKLFCVIKFFHEICSLVNICDCGNIYFNFIKVSNLLRMLKEFLKCVR